MSLTTVIASKESNYQPALLAQFVFPDGSILYASTHNLNASEGGNQYQSNDYLARIAEQDIAAVQARSEQGIDRISDVTLHLYNADQVVLNDYEMAADKGFKGAILKLSLILMDIDPATGNYTFSTDSTAPVKFQGICDAASAESGGSMVTVRATTSHNLGRVDFPIIHVQQRCVNYFPRDAFERLAGATDISSWQWGCGYNPDQTGTDPEIGGDCRRGNTTTPGATDAQGRVIADGSGNYVSCNYTKADCVARGMYTQDSTSRPTGRFTAIQWGPDRRESIEVSYAHGKVTVFSARNDSIYDRSYPMVYGTQWVKRPIVANVLGDGNATRFEVVICVGDIGTTGVLPVVVNGVVVPPLGVGADKLFRWNFLDQSAIASTHTGGRNGHVNSDNGWNSGGDPYGGLATIEVVVYSDLAQSNSVPDVKVLTRGPKLIKYAPIATYVNGVITLPSGVANADISGNSPFTVQVLGCSLSGANGVWGLTSWTAGPPGTVTLTGAPVGSGTGGYIRYLARSNNPAWVVFDMLIWGNYSFTEIDIPSVVAAASVCDTAVTYTDLTGNSASHARFIAELALEDRRKANEAIQALLRSFNAQLVPNSETGLLQMFIRQTLADQQPAAISGSNYNTAVLSYLATDSMGSPTGSGYVAYLIDESIIQQDGNGIPKIRGPYCQPNAQAPNRINIPFQDADNQYAEDSISVVDPDDVSRAAGYQLGGQAIDAGISILGVSNFDQGMRVSNVILAENLRGNENGDTRGTRFWDVETTHRLEHLRVGHIVLFRYQANSLQPAVQLESPPATPIAGILCRVEAIKPTTNYQRMTVTLRWHEDVWYTDEYGQHPAPILSDPRKSMAARPPYSWKPYAEQPITGDTIWGAQEWSFAVAQSYGTAADGASVATLSLQGNPPLNQPSDAVQPPLVALQGTTATTGGTIPGGQRIYGAIAAQDSAGKWSLLSRPFSVDIPTGTNTNTATTPTIRWQSGTSNWALFAGLDEQRWSKQSTGSGTASTITITALNAATYGPPDIMADSLQFRVKRIYHGGVFGDVCTAVASLGGGQGTISFATATTASQFAEVDSTHGYDLSKLANALGDTGNVGIADFHVVDNDGAGVYTVTPDPAGLVSAGDVFVMRAFPSTITSTTIGDANFANAYSPGGTGLTASAEIGRRLRIIAGTGRGQERTIISNTTTVLTVDSRWDTTPDTTSRFIVEEATWQDEPVSKQSSAVLTASPAPTVAVFPIDNYRTQTVLVQALVADANGKTSIARFSPMREIYIWGGQGTRSISTSDTQLPTDGLVLCDASGVTQPAADSLAAAITTTVQTAVTLTTGTATVNGTDLLCGTERMRIVSGGGTVNVVVTRGNAGTTAATHINGSAVTVPGALTFTCLASASVPNVKLGVKKTDTSINYVAVLAGGSDTFDSGSTSILLADNTDAAGFAYVQFPG